MKKTVALKIEKPSKQALKMKKLALCVLLSAGVLVLSTPSAKAAEFTSNVTTQNVGATGFLPSNVQYYPPNSPAAATALNNLNNNNVNNIDVNQNSGVNNYNSNYSSGTNSISTIPAGAGPTNMALPPEAAAQLNQAVQNIRQQQVENKGNASVNDPKKPAEPAGPQDVGYNKMMAEKNKVRVLPSTGIENHNKSSQAYYTEQGKIEEDRKIVEAYRRMYSEKK